MADSKMIYKCPYCSNKYIANNKEERAKAKSALYDHMEDVHFDMLGGMSPAQAYFNYKYKKSHGSCVMDSKETKWNEQTERYERFCSDRCKEAYRQEFRKRMINKYGKDTLLNDPEVQKKMLANRKISGEYLWSDKKTKTSYVGSYEREFLEFLDLVMNFNPKDVMSPAPQIYSYKHEGKDRFYIPDFYIASLNLLIEIKDGGSNPNKHHKIQEVDKVKEKIKDEMMMKQKDVSYIKVTDKDYSILLNFLIQLKYGK